MNFDELTDKAMERRYALSGDDYSATVIATSGDKFVLYGPVVDGLGEGSYLPELSTSVADLLVEMERMLVTGYALESVMKAIVDRAHGPDAVVSMLDDVWAWERA